MRSAERIRWTALTLLVWLAGCALCACGSQARPAIRVGSKLFPEQLTLGEMYAILLEDRGLTVERKLAGGNGPALNQALLDGALDLYPEYTGTGLQQILGLPSENDPARAYASVAAAYKQRFNLIWLDPAPLNNTFALAMTRYAAARHGVASIPQLVAKAGGLSMIGPPDFDGRSDGLAGLRGVYGDFTLRRYIAVDSTIRYKGLIDGQADIVVAYATDGEISAYDLLILDDPKRFFPAYQLAPVVRQQTLDQFPELAPALNALAPHLTNEAMQRLNYEVSGKNRQPAEVAREFLIQEGLIQGTP